MKRNIMARILLFVVLTLSSLYCRADMAGPTYIYNYHALSRLDFYVKTLNELGKKAGLTGSVLLDFLLIGATLALAVCVFVLMLKRKLRLDVGVTCLLILSACILFCLSFGHEIIALCSGGAASYDHDPSARYEHVGRVDVDVVVPPEKGETYKEYSKRVYRMEHHLCPRCDCKMYQIYDMGLRWVCDNCNYGRRNAGGM